MANIPIEDLKLKFQTGDYPVQSDYEDLIDTLNPNTLAASLDEYVPLTEKGQPNGVAELDANGYVPATQLDIDFSPYYTSTQTDAAISTAIANLVDTAPATLDTLNELAAALGDDPNFATTVTNSIAAKADASHTHSVSDVTNLQTSLDSKTNKNQTVVTKTSNYTVNNSDNQSLILCDGTFTIYISVVDVGARFDFINIGTGTITLNGGMYTLVGKDGALTLDTQYAAASIVVIDANTAIAVGSLA